MASETYWKADFDLDWRNWTVGVEWGETIRIVCVGPLLFSWSEAWR